MAITVEEAVASLKKSLRYRNRVEHIQILSPRNALYGKLSKDLPREIEGYLSKKAIRLYKHQCEAIEKLRVGKNIIITTPTASGKTLAFNLPIFERLQQNKKAAALYLYPTKALSQDQLKVMKELENMTGINTDPDVYDGDTPSYKKRKIRERARIIISNPYELHQILPWHYRWQRFFSSLEFVVIDEAHRYRGVFGSNIAFLLRRLRRICKFYGSCPQFILSTATLANPLEFSEKLTGLDFELISSDGSPKGKKYFIFYNPYFDGVGILSTHQESIDLFLFFIKKNLQTLCFTVSRKMAESIVLGSKRKLKESEQHLASKITAYRAGYLPQERRDIEDRLKRGLLKGIVSTNALELGIDIGSLDAVLISGYPGTVISTWQQAGRAGRGTNESIATLVAFQNPLDQYFMKHPRVFFDKPHEQAVVDLTNPYIVSGQLMCAAAELPVQLEEEEMQWGKNMEDILEVLQEENLLQKTASGWVYSGKGRTVDAVSLNSISSDTFKVIYQGKLLETMDRTQAYREAYKGAVLFHQGETYLVKDLDLENLIIQVKKKDVDYYTQAMKIVDMKVLKEAKRKNIDGFIVSLGEVKVSEKYIKYRRMKYDKVLGMENLSLPPLNFKTIALWITVPENIIEKVRNRGLDFAGGLHGLEHALIGIMPFHVMCDRWDIGGVSVSNYPFIGESRVFLYDGFEGGIGLTEKAFQLSGDIFQMTYELVRDCQCEEGCPACIYSPKCGNGNRPLDKEATKIILKGLTTIYNNH